MSAVAEIDDFKRQLNVVSDAEFAALLGYQRSTVAQWKKRGAVPAAAKHSIRQHIESRTQNEKGRAAFSKIPPTKRQFAKALVIRFLIDSTIEADGDLEPDELLFKAMEMDNFELAAARLLDARIANGSRDLAAAFRHILTEGDLPLAVGKELTAMMRDYEAG